jgi:hypothetical protein
VLGFSVAAEGFVLVMLTALHKSEKSPAASGTGSVGHGKHGLSFLGEKGGEVWNWNTTGSDGGCGILGEGDEDDKPSWDGWMDQFSAQFDS